MCCFIILCRDWCKIMVFRKIIEHPQLKIRRIPVRWSSFRNMASFVEQEIRVIKLKSLTRSVFGTQSTVLPVPTRHRRHACIKMRTALPANTKTRPNVFQCWSSEVGGGPILKQHWVKCSRLRGSTQVSVYTHPSATIIFSPADQGTFSKTAGQSKA